MKLRQLAAAALGAAALSLLSGAAKAADTVVFAAAGSSAQFATFTQAFLNSGYSNHYSLKTQSTPIFTVNDPAANPENAQVAIYWSGTTGAYNIAVFYQVDSTVGVRAFFNSDTLAAPAAAPAPGNVGLPKSGDQAVPAEILAAINGTKVNVGATDITPEDARVATQRSLNLGYNAANNPILSGVAGSSSVANPVPFTIGGAGSFKLTPLGAVPVMVFVNNGGPTFGSSGSSALLGSTNPNLNIDSFQLAGFLSGQFDRTSDLILAPGAAQNPVHTYIREPLSGTYNTMEFTNPESTAKLAFTGGQPSGSITSHGGQELNVASNPLNEPANGAGNGVANAGRIRAIGSGELINAVASDTTDALGYSFWSVGSFSGKAVKYLTVDGADPIQDNYTGGAVTGATVTFRNIINGGYPLWSILRVVTASSPTLAISTIVTAAQKANQGMDFIPFNQLAVFRSYHVTPYTPGGPAAVSSGNNGTPANGGDVGGAVFSINDDQDYALDTGNDLSGIRQ